jgi:preprotein translocase subunit YajC
VTVTIRRAADPQKVNGRMPPMQGITDLAASSSSSSGGFNPTSLLLILVVVVAFYLLMIRPQQRRRQQAQQQANTLGPGARVRTTAGMYATVVDVDGDDVILEVAPGVEVRYMKRAVMEVISSGDPVDTLDEDAVDEDTGDEDVDSDVEADKDETAEEHDVEDDAESAGTTSEADTADSEESAYERATGTKKD